jgi:branched-chain amino acid transport system ATP-binding protein
LGRPCGVQFMNEILLSAKNLSVRFGGVLAVSNVSFDVRQGEVFTLIGPNGAGKTTVFNLISRIYTPTMGEIDYAGPNGMIKLTTQPPQNVASLGIARTFQNIELFEHASVLHNLLIGRHTHRATGFWQDLFFTGRVREAELKAREKAEEVIEFLNLQHYRDTFVAGLPYGVRKVVEMARALCARNPSSCCWTSHPADSMSRKPTTWRSGFRTSNTNWVSPC